MTILQNFGENEIKSIVRLSNYWATKNRNSYPVQMNNAIQDMYESVPCPCNQCTCTTLGCDYHWRLKNNVQAQLFQHHFLHCFVNTNIHASVMNSSPASKVRGARAAQIIYQEIANNWSELRMIAHGLTTACDAKVLFQELDSIRLGQGDAIYRSKLYSLLNIDSNIPFDSTSKRQLRRDIGSNNLGDIHRSLQSDLRRSLAAWQITLEDFRLIDEPNTFDKLNIYTPNRPIGRILDKIYYSP